MGICCPMGIDRHKIAIFKCFLAIQAMYGNTAENISQEGKQLRNIWGLGHACTLMLIICV